MDAYISQSCLHAFGLYPSKHFLSMISMTIRMNLTQSDGFVIWLFNIARISALCWRAPLRDGSSHCQSGLSSFSWYRPFSNIYFPSQWEGWTVKLGSGSLFLPLFSTQGVCGIPLIGKIFFADCDLEVTALTFLQHSMTDCCIGQYNCKYGWRYTSF